MGFEDTIILFENFNEPLSPIGNNIPTLSAQANIKLDDDQKFEFARIYVQVCGGSITGLAFRAEFNGKTLGSKTWAAFENGCKTLDVPVTDLMKNGKNTLKIHLDGRLSNQEVQIYADLFYRLNTQEGPEQVETTDPKKDEWIDKLIPIAIGITAAAIVGGIITTIISTRAKTVKAIVRR